MTILDHEPPAVPAPRRGRVSLSLILWLIVLAAAGVTVLTNLGEARKIAEVMAGAKWYFVLAAAAVEVAFAVNLGLFYASTFRATGLRANVPRLVLIAQAGYFVNLVSKTGGLGGIGLYLEEARRTGESRAAASVAYLMAFVLGYAAYFAVLVAVLLLLFLQGNLNLAEAVSAGISITLIVVIGGFMLAGLRSEEALERMYRRAMAPLNAIARLLRRGPFVDPEVAHENAAQIYEAVERLKRRPRSYAVPFAHAMAVEFLATALLYLVARSVGANLSLDHALAAYVISLLFSMIAITPAGLGFVEASLSVLLISFGASRQNAIAAALGYRLFEFWLPVLLGLLSLAVLKSARGGEGR